MVWGWLSREDSPIFVQLGKAIDPQPHEASPYTFISCNTQLYRKRLIQCP
jgi:hypothetical protein